MINMPNFERKYIWKNKNEHMNCVFDENCIIDGEERLKIIESLMGNKND